MAVQAQVHRAAGADLPCAGKLYILGQIDIVAIIIKPALTGNRRPHDIFVYRVAACILVIADRAANGVDLIIGVPDTDHDTVVFAPHLVSSAVAPEILHIRLRIHRVRSAAGGNRYTVALRGQSLPDRHADLRALRQRGIQRDIFAWFLREPDIFLRARCSLLIQAGGSIIRAVLPVARDLCGTADGHIYLAVAAKGAADRRQRYAIAFVSADLAAVDLKLVALGNIYAVAVAADFTAAHDEGTAVDIHAAAQTVRVGKRTVRSAVGQRDFTVAGAGASSFLSHADNRSVACHSDVVPVQTENNIGAVSQKATAEREITLQIVIAIGKIVIGCAIIVVCFCLFAVDQQLAVGRRQRIDKCIAVVVLMQRRRSGIQHQISNRFRGGIEHAVAGVVAGDAVLVAAAGAAVRSDRHESPICRQSFNRHADPRRGQSADLHGGAVMQIDVAGLVVLGVAQNLCAAGNIESTA